MEQIELDDSTLDRYLLDITGTSLLVFYSRNCPDCRLARARLPETALSVQRLCWVDAAENQGATERYEVEHLPSLFLVRDGTYYGAIHATLDGWDIRRQIALALQSWPAELP